MESPRSSDSLTLGSLEVHSSGVHSLKVHHSAQKKQKNTWINDDIKYLYIKLNKLGYVHSVECWKQNTLIGENNTFSEEYAL